MTSILKQLPLETFVTTGVVSGNTRRAVVLGTDTSVGRGAMHSKAPDSSKQIAD
jgi:hypothetical protein